MMDSLFGRLLEIFGISGKEMFFSPRPALCRVRNKGLCVPRRR